MTVSKIADLSSRDITVFPDDVLVIRSFPSVWIMFSTEMAITEEDQYEINENSQLVDKIRPVIKGFHINVVVRSSGKAEFYHTVYPPPKKKQTKTKQNKTKQNKNKTNKQTNKQTLCFFDVGSNRMMNKRRKKE